MLNLFDLLTAKIICGSSGGGGSAVLTNLTITQDGIYTPAQGIDGYNYITCDVSSHFPDGDAIEY